MKIPHPRILIFTPGEFEKALSWYVLSLERKDFVPPSLPSLGELDDKALALWGLVARGEDKEKVEKELEKELELWAILYFGEQLISRNPGKMTVFQLRLFCLVFRREKKSPG